MGWIKNILRQFVQEETDDVQPAAENPNTITRYLTIRDLLRDDILESYKINPAIGHFQLSVCGDTAEKYLRGGTDSPPCRVQAPDGQFYCRWVEEIGRYVREKNKKKKPGEQRDSPSVCRHLDPLNPSSFRLAEVSDKTAVLYRCAALTEEEKRIVVKARATQIKKAKNSGRYPNQ